MCVINSYSTYTFTGKAFRCFEHGLDCCITVMNTLASVEILILGSNLFCLFKNVVSIYPLKSSI